MCKRTVVVSLVAWAALCIGATIAQAASVNVGSASGAQNSTVTFSVTLSTGTASVAGVQNDITFDKTNTPLGTALTSPGKCSTTTTTSCLDASQCPSGETCNRLSGPDCTSSLAGKQAAFSFVDDHTMRAVVAGVVPPNKDPIPDNSTLYTCKINIPVAAVAGMYDLTPGGVGLSDPDGGAVATTAGTTGKITVTGGGCIGDCDHNGEVSAGELLRGLDILLGNIDPSDCDAWNGDVSAGKLLTGLDNLLLGCP